MSIALTVGTRPFAPACMYAPEQTMWEMFNRRLKTPGVTPCADCLAPFAAEMVTKGRCDGYPGRARYSSFASSAQLGRPRAGAPLLDPVERLERRRASWRKYQRKRHARQKARDG